jgi:hypothetical protein
MSIKEFLDKNPSIEEVAKFIESEAQRIAEDRNRKKQGGDELCHS